MSENSLIAKIASELEDAGWLGLTAGGILAMFYLAEGTPGVWAATDIGMVWTKCLTGSGQASPHRFKFGIGELVIEAGLASCTAGFQMEGDRVSQLDLTFAFFSSTGGASKIFIELGEEYAMLADKEKSNNKVVGYKEPLSPFKIELPVSGQLEFQFRVLEGTETLYQVAYGSGSTAGSLNIEMDYTITSAVKLYSQLATVADMASGIIELSLNDKVLVIPKLFDVGIIIEKLFLDLSNTSASTFVQAFPDAYTTDWKGIGATQVGIIVPIDKKDKEFVVADMEGFLLGFDGAVSLKGNITYNTQESGKLLQNLAGTIEINNNEVIRSDLSATLNLKGSADKLQANVSNAPMSGVSQKADDLNKEGKNKLESKKDQLASFNGLLKLQIGFAKMDWDGKEVWGLDAQIQGVSVNGADSGLVFSSDVGCYLFWIFAAGLGGYLIYDGSKNDEGEKLAGGAALLAFLIMDTIVHFGANDAVLPRLDKFSFTHLGYRYIHLLESNTTTQIHQILLDCRIKFKLDSALMQFVSALSSTVLTAVGSLDKLFAKEKDEILIKGFIDLELANTPLTFLKKSNGDVEFDPEIDETIRRLFKVKDFRISAKELPAIILKEGTQTEAGDFPKPIVGAQFVSKESQPDNKYGLALVLKGFGNSSFTVTGPAMGVVIYFWPEFDLELTPQLAIEPKITFLIPGIIYAEGVIDLDKPIPSFDGKQNRVAVDVGVICTKVPTGGKISKDKMKALFSFNNYQWTFGGEYVWGEVGVTATDPKQKYEFVFVEAHLEGKSPFFTIGPVGVYGLGGLFGKNIAPGMPGDQRSAMAIANWIQGADQFAEGKKPFQNVLDWPPEGPSNDTWHPARDFENDKDLYTIGLVVKAGSGYDNGKTYMVDSILIGGFPQFWIALAGWAIIKPISANLAVVIVLDLPSYSFVIRAVIEYKIEKDTGNILIARGGFELGTVNRPEWGLWIYLGHYSDSKGGPISAELFKLFGVKAYYVFDTADMKDFGLQPPGPFDRPTIPGPAFGTGVMYQLGPKAYGPSFLNVQLHAAMGYNLAISFDPFMVYGDIYAFGSVRLKIFFFKFKLGLSAQLYGMAAPLKYFRFGGEITVEIGLPWPFPDIDASFSFSIDSGDDKDAIPDSKMGVTALGLRRFETQPSLETSAESGNDTPLTIPIDGIIAIRFTKPVFQILKGPGSHTDLLLNDPGNTVGEICEKATSQFDTTTYEIKYTHKIQHFRVYCKKKGQEFPSLLNEIPASWDTPEYNEQGQADPKQEPHHVLYLNSLMPWELETNSERLGRFYNGQAHTGTVPVCTAANKVCLMTLQPLSDVVQNEITGLNQISFSTAIGDVDIFEFDISDGLLYLLPANIHRLAWTQTELVLPRGTKVQIPHGVELEIDLLIETDAHSALLKKLEIYLDVHLWGGAKTSTAILSFTPTADPTLVCCLRMDVDIQGVDSSIIDIHTHITDCSIIGELRLKIMIAISHDQTTIRFLRLRGPYFYLRPSTDNFKELASSRKVMERLLASTRMRLTELCITQASPQRDHWQSTEIASWNSDGTPATTPEQSIEATLESFLLEPDADYSVTYELITDAGATSSNGEAKDLEKKSGPVQSSPDGQMRHVKFRTEKMPSQNIVKYLGFTFPDAATTPLYTQCFTPVMTFKYNGLIKKIFKKHYGFEALVSGVVDINGIALRKLLSKRVSIGSKPTDAALEDLFDACLPEAKHMTYLEAEVWERSLKPDTWHALQVKNISDQLDPKVPFSIRFKTSKYPDLDAHIKAIESLYENAVQIPLLDQQNAAGAITSALSQILADNAISYDELLEQLYRRLIGIDDGRLTNWHASGEEMAGYLVSMGPAGQIQVWAALVELDEPIITKEGLGIANLSAGHSQLLERGAVVIQQNGQNRTIVHDKSGSRMVIFNSLAESQVNTLQTETRINLSFSMMEAVRHSVQRYVDKILVHKPEPHRVKKTADLVFELEKAHPQIGDAFKTRTKSLKIPSI